MNNKAEGDMRSPSAFFFLREIMYCGYPVGC